MPVEIFCCYARKDQQLLQHLMAHLMPLQRQGLITLWSDTNINAGTEWELEITKHLNTSQIILLLVSPDFMMSEYIYSKEMKRAIERHNRGEATIIPIILRWVSWQRTPLGKLQALPKDGKPVKSWQDEDEAFYIVVEGIHKVIEKLIAQPSTYSALAAVQEVKDQNASVSISPPVSINQKTQHASLDVGQRSEFEKPTFPDTSLRLHGEGYNRVRNQVFISYSHKERKWLEILQTALKPLLSHIPCSIWDDTMIKAGKDWRKEINDALASAKVAVLLVSPNFLASDLIAEHELLPLLDAAKSDGLVIFWIAIRNCLYQVTEIERYQALNDPSNPLARLGLRDRDNELVNICKQIALVANQEFKNPHIQ